MIAEILTGGGRQRTLKQPKEPKYPFVRCEHGKDEPGFLVCPHVAHGQASVAEVTPASEKELGAIVCKRCVNDLLRQIDGLVFCVHHVKEKGWLKT